MCSEWSRIPHLRLLGIRGMPLTVPSSAGSGGSFPRHEAWWSEITLMGIDLTAFYTCSEEDACSEAMTRSRVKGDSDAREHEV